MVQSVKFVTQNEWFVYLEYKTGVKQLVCAFGAMHKFDIFYEFCSLCVWNWFESK